MSISIGTHLGSYEITALLGKGGMGEVYRARDAKLKREVAIKILPDEVSRDPDRVSRFQREGQVLASLNHPNIAAIYDLEEAGDSRYLVLELVEGETLAERLKHGTIPIEEALNIAKSICEALEAAHEKGVVHRDLKPANVKITPDGKVKVLDFGLAKALETKTASGDPADWQTVTAGETEEGIILGTAAYMSPEQARGKPLDKRTDIWAFGCVLYEMVTRQLAFTGETVSDVIAAILERQPKWDTLPERTPAIIRHLLQRCLEKDPKRRLRDIGDARVEIEDLTMNWDSENRPASDLHRMPRIWRAFALVTTAALIAVTIFAVWLARRAGVAPGTGSAAAPTFSRVVRLTSGPGQKTGPTISPDGKWIAYLSNARGPTDVWVKFIAGGDAINLTAATDLEISSGTIINGPDISSDGTRIAVTARMKSGNTSFEPWEVPAPLPGAPRRLVEGGTGLRWSPDGRQVTYIRAGASAGDALWVADADATNRREIIKAHGGWHIHWPSWSPDGYIYFIYTIAGNAEPSQIYRIKATGGEMEPAVRATRRAVFPLPMPDGKGLIYSANPSSADLGLWWRPTNGAAAVRLTMGIGEYAEPRISADGRTLVCTLYEVHQSLSRIDVTSKTDNSTIALTDQYNGDQEPTIAPQGDQVVFSSSRGGSRHLWRARLDGSNPQPLTAGDSFDERPSFSPDGRQIAFISDKGGQRAIWLMNSDGGSPHKLTDAMVLGGLSWSRDGQRLVFASPAGDWPGLWVVSTADGRVQRLVTTGSGPAAEPAWSPTRDLIAYMSISDTGPAFTRLAFVDTLGQPAYAALPPPPGPNGFSNGTSAWSPDGRRLAVTSQNTNLPVSIWIVDPEAPNPYHKLAEFPLVQRIRGIAWTRDGASVIIGKYDTSSDIVLMDQAQ